MLLFHGKLTDPASAMVPADDHGLLYGAGGFETFRTFGGKVFLLEQHLARLRRTLAPLCIENLDTLLLASTGKLEAGVHKLLEASGRADAVFRYTVSAGPAGHHLPQGPYLRPWDMLILRELPPKPPADGITLRVTATARDSGERSPRGKSLAYTNSLIAWREQEGWGQAGAQGLMLTPVGMVSEGVTCNIFWIQNGTLCTPSVETGLLPGVHRAHIMELAKANGIPVATGAWPVEELCRADSIFTINAVTGPVLVRELQDVNGKTIWRRNAVASGSILTLLNVYEASLPA